ncbi:Trichoplein keratin filament-binding protein [Hondaea fermentalgiana]|uniref:Cilia- and flagella-associated protein 53 n=1 Tax=Hondaea fermentalgiana TaxID=2315210 RepID=A0A2R5GLV9_9STRA|nr:Trichoplein keratin filament-binding protein [Hondaea fermentalgiana]|eukprot:GBG31867.1 Trichoplein keratin filament-binding protein [Hondaea fermentalgiana]
MDAFKPTRKLPADYTIIKRREGEQRRAHLEAGIRQVDRFTDLAKWEQKSEAAMARQRVRAGMQQRLAAHEQNLDRRRRALADLLQREREQLEEEFRNSFETPEQRRVRMAARAKQLKDDREAKRQALAKKCLEQRDRLAQDEMRLQQSKMRTLKVTRDRGVQLDERRAKEEARAREDEEFAREWHASIEVKRAREERERREAAVRNEEMRTMLDSQVQELRKRRQAEVDELEARRAQWRAQWRAEEDEEREAAIRREEEQRLARIAVQQENLDRAMKRAAEAEAEQRLDKYLLNQQLEGDRKAAENERAKQAEMRKASQDYQAHLRELAIREARDESDLERIRQEESEKVWLKREAQWSADAEARARLMKEVDETRQRQIAERQNQALEERLADEDYIARQRKLDEEANERHRQHEREERGRRMLNQDLLRAQIDEKARLAAIERQRELLIDQRAARYTEEFNKKIEKLREEATADADLLENFPRRTFEWT